MHQLAFEGHDLPASVLYFRDEDGQSYELPVSDELLRVLGAHAAPSQTAGATGSASHSGSDSAVTIIEQVDPTDTATDTAQDTERAYTERANNALSASSQDHHAGTDNEHDGNTAPNLAAVPSSSSTTNENSDGSTDGAAHMPDANSSAQQEPKPEIPHMVPTGGNQGASGGGRGMADRDRSRNQPMSMRPNQIQQRIRAGASAQELADEMGVDVSRVEPFAHPVILERERIAEMAKQAHPVRDGGPDRLTLWEVLATSFAARGHSLADAHWDAHRSVAGEPWTIEVTWTAGLSQNSAQWLFHRHPTSADTVEPRNPVAADLVDPDFIQPVRSVTSLTRPQRVGDDARDAYNAGFDGLISGDQLPEDELSAHKQRKRAGSHPLQTADTSRNAIDNPGSRSGDEEDTRDDIPVVADGDGTADETSDRTDRTDTEQTNGDPANDGQAQDNEFLQHPDSEAPKKRRRKATTPHWEDVLLGVRANTKRPRR
ncbi:septation protein SepH [Corynebacterium propinquum]|uniref:septation protein SepH n=1 Tax=Corynebacterium propinquum TaxID=43769 RepID=UPI003CAE52E3